jgi:hypothetical protein
MEWTAAAVLHRAGGADGARRVRERRAPTEPMIDRLHWLAVAAAFGLLTGLRHLRRFRQGAAIAGQR